MSHSPAKRLPLNLRLDLFEGPLDLLLYLIHERQLEITKVSISQITDQYLLYIRLMHELDFDIAGEFLVMAATLIQWKSKAILPREPGEEESKSEDEDPFTPEDLIRQIRDHQLFLSAGQELNRRPLLGQEVFEKGNQKPLVHRVWREMNLSDLTLSLQDLLIRAKTRTQVLKKETVSLTDKIEELGQRLRLGASTALRDLMSLTPDRPEIVVTFLAGLELSRLKKLLVHQQGNYEPIYLELIELIGQLDHTLIQKFESTFDEETATP